KFADSRQTRAVSLNKAQCTGLQKILKQHAVGNVFPSRNLYRSNFTGENNVCVNVIGVGRLFQPQWLELSERAAHTNGVGQTPVLVSVEHDYAVITYSLTQHLGTPQITLFIRRSNF